MGDPFIGSLGAIRAPVPPDSWRTLLAAPRALADHAFTFIVSVRNQLSLGSCTGFAYRTALQIISALPVELSPLALYFYNQIESGFTPSDDRGAYMEQSVRALMKWGAGSEVLHPYVEADLAKGPSAAYLAQARDHRVSAYYRALTVHEMKSALTLGVPVVSSFDVPPSFGQVGETGVWADNGGSAIGGHAVCVVGYDNRQHGGAFLVQNSWGDKWGVKHPYAQDKGEGYFWVPYTAMAGPRWFDGIVVQTFDTEAGS